jgi:hypothetical protein
MDIPMPDMRLFVVDEFGNILERGRVGVLIIRGFIIMLGRIGRTRS